VFGIVLELLVVEEYLFACCKYEVCAAVNALEHSIFELHGRLPSQGRPTEIGHGFTLLAGPGSLPSFILQNKGPDRTRIRAVIELCPESRANLKTLHANTRQSIFRNPSVSTGFRNRAHRFFLTLREPMARVGFDRQNAGELRHQ
jgi:hypothetical protein